MKTKVTLTIDEELLPEMKRYARAKGMSLSELVENALRNINAQRSASGSASFSSRWRGKFKPAEREDSLSKFQKPVHQTV